MIRLSSLRLGMLVAVSSWGYPENAGAGDPVDASPRKTKGASQIDAEASTPLPPTRLADAESRDEEDESDRRKRARQLFREGSELSLAERWSDALGKYAASYELFASPSTLYNMAVCYEHLGQPAQALFFVDRSLLAGDDALAEPRRSQALELRDALVEELSVVQLTLEQETAVSIDGSEVLPLSDGSYLAAAGLGNGAPPLPVGSPRIFVAPGNHSIVLQSKSAKQEDSFQIEAGESTQLSLPNQKLSPLRPESARPETVRPESASRIPPIPAESTAHAVVQKTAPVSDPFEPLPAWRRNTELAGWVLLGAGAVTMLVSGIVVAETSGTLSAECDQNELCASHLASTKQRNQDATTAFNVGFWTGIGGGVLGASMLVWRKVERRPLLGVRLTPTSVAISGSF